LILLPVQVDDLSVAHHQAILLGVGEGKNEKTQLLGAFGTSLLKFWS
jgi:hypothetical protein